MSNSLDIILPCYNPPENWTVDIIEMDKALKVDLPDFDLHWIIVNDGSESELSPAIEKLDAFKISMDFLDHEFNRGKGYALRAGCQISKAKFIIYTDIDLPYEYDSFINILKALRSNGSDVAIGVRDDNYFAKIPRQRRIISRIVRFLNKKLMRLAHSDTQCGLKGFKSKGKAIFLETKTDRYLIDLEFLKHASKTLEIKAVPVVLKSKIELPEISGTTLRSEFLSYLKILFS